MKSLFLTVFFSATATVAVYSQQYEVSQPGEISIIPEFQNLRSTHGNDFRGGSIIISKKINPAFSIGGGIEYTHAGYHDDNGWDLTNLQFIPIFIDGRYFPIPSGQLRPYFHISTGISFNSYMKQIRATNDPAFKVAEKGLYGYAGVGGQYHIKRKFAVIAELGIKGPKLSFNNLDVNPHGITARIGIVL